MATAELGPNLGGEDVGLYATGFLDAARVLFEHADQGHGLVDLYFYPAAFNLRHGLELMAKQLADYGAYYMRDRTLLYVPGHGLDVAWQSAAKIPREILHNDYSFGERNRLLELFDEMDTLVAKMHALDPRGTLFRYPEWVATRVVDGEKVRVRQDTDIPRHLLRPDLTAWAHDCAEAVTASQFLLGYFSDATDALRTLRNEPPEKLADLVMRYVPPDPNAR